jgi:AAA15 family ATPase/GTPase
MINHIHIKNFKSWADTGKIPLAPLTGFFGANSSGKTSLLQMLLLLRQTVESSDRNIILSTESLAGGITIPELIHDEEDNLIFELNWDVRASRLPHRLPILLIDKLTFMTEITRQDKVSYVQRFNYSTDNLSAGMQHKADDRYSVQIHTTIAGLEGLEKLPQISKPPIKCYGFSPDVVLFYQDTYYLNNLVYEFEQQMQQVYHLGPIRDYPQRIYRWAGEEPYEIGQNGELTISALLAKGNENIVLDNTAPITLLEKISYWLFEMGILASFKIEPISPFTYQVRVKRHANSQEVLFPDVGFGVSQVLPVLVMCYYCPPNSTIILEQPEMHLHPAVQSILADVLIDAIKTRHVQIIFESHSEHLLARLQRRIAEEKITNEDTALYFCDIVDGQSMIKQLEVDDYGNIRNYPKDFFGDLTGDLFEMAQSGIRRKFSE